jgi:hypothetical protein
MERKVAVFVLRQILNNRITTRLSGVGLVRLRLRAESFLPVFCGRTVGYFAKFSFCGFGFFACLLVGVLVCWWLLVLGVLYLCTTDLQ